MKKLISWVLRHVPRKTLQRFQGPVLWVLDIWYRGEGLVCPINNKSYRKFLPYGRLHPRPNALCPGSLSLERHRLIWLYLKEKTNFFHQTLKFLHVAPETCFMEKFESQHGEGYITADIESPLAKVKMDVHAIPFEANTFDAAMCNHVMEHVTNDLQAMGELFRVLKPGGWAIIQVPFFPPLQSFTIEDLSINDPKERERLFGQDDHVRKYGTDYADRLRSVGFKVKEDDFVRTLSSEAIKKYALPAEEIIYFCQKPNQEKSN
jgi:SAM-dependent methyltransferase